jgi:hypothetical protein
LYAETGESMDCGSDLTGKSAAKAEPPKSGTSAAVKMLLKFISPTPVRTHEKDQPTGVFAVNP